MIVSHEHRFIFLKTRKTAGTTVEIALSRACGPDDVLTPIQDTDEELRAEAGGRGPANYQPPGVAVRVWGHAPAQRARRAVGRDVWNSYFKFAVERNPWDTVVSLYFWRFKDPENRPPFEDFVLSERPQRLAEKNAEIYRIRGAVAVDHMLRQEQLAADVAMVWDKLGLPGEPDLVRAKSGTRPKEATGYRELYTPETRDRIAVVFGDVIELLGYEF